MIQLSAGWLLPAQDLEFRYVRSGGPGGQNVNKLATKVELRLDLNQTQALTGGQIRRLVGAYPSCATRAGHFLLTSDRFRTQGQNQKDVMERLRSMILAIRLPPKPRLNTKPSRASKRRRLATKRARGQTKRLRRAPSDD